jgi:site-specific DNA recombinase
VFPVITGSGGIRPGQIRDKFWSRDHGGTNEGPARYAHLWALPMAQSRRLKWAAKRKDNRKKPSAASQRRQQQLVEVNAELDRLVAEFHAILPRSEAEQIGGIYARYSTQFQDSIVDQVRSLLEFAVRNRIFVPREFIFVDLAEKGGKERRPGLIQLREALAGCKFKTLLVFSTNRFFRKAYKSIKLVEEEIVERGLRCVFVKSGIDTGDKDRWRLHLQMLSGLDEAYSTIYAESIRESHVGLASQMLVHGTLAVGYRGEPIPGQFTKRRRPRCIVAIDEAAAPYVRQVFTWFAIDLLHIDEIVRRLNDDPEAPRPPKSEDDRWSHKAVLHLLKNPRYIGIWDYGKTESRWISSADYSRQFPREKPLGTFFFEELRIIDDALWHKAQVRLATFVERRGRKPGTSKKKPASRLLNGLLFCTKHECDLRIGGANAGVFYCKLCRETSAERRPLFTLLNQQLAERCTIRAIRELLVGDPSLVDMIVAACQRAAEQCQQPDVARLGQLRTRLQQLSRAIEVAIRDPGETAEDQQETHQLVRQLRQERSQISAEIGILESARDQPVRVPTREEVEQELARFEQVLEAAASGADAGDRALARVIVELVTGGRIELFQCGERAQHKGWLRGEIHCDLIGNLASRLAGQNIESEEPSTLIVVEFREPSMLDTMAQKARALFEQGVLNVEIGRRLKCSKSRVTRLLRHAFEQTGEVKPDGRTRRSQLEVKHTEVPLYQRIANQVMALMQEGMLLGDIASRLECDRNTITHAVRHWHNSRGLPVPDGRTRRKSLPRRRRRKGDGDSGAKGE